MYLKDNDKLNFIVDLYHTFNEKFTGGIVVLHYLAYKIAEKGHNVYIFCQPEYPHENITVLPGSKINDGFMTYYHFEPFNFPLFKTISIYPQITRWNPYNTSCVSRWILYHTQEDIESTYNEEDQYFNFSNFNTYRKTEMSKLTLLDYHLNDLYVTNEKDKRDGYCHILNKNTQDNFIQTFDDFKSVDITNWQENGGYEYLREQFNKYEFFLTYDQNTFMTVAAALCGCKSIILNPFNYKEHGDNAFIQNYKKLKYHSPTEFRIKNPLQLFGVAYGIDDLPWAEKTLDLVRDHCENLKELDEKTLSDFIDFWENKLL